MCAGRVIIPTHEDGLDIVRKRGAAPDDFIQEKIDEFAAGNSGLPGR
jgi:hypothetical protein